MWRRFQIGKDEMVLLVEDIVTTSSTLRAVRSALRSGNNDQVLVAPIVQTVVHRSDDFVVDGAKVDYLLHLDIQTWKPESCPLCAAGSKRIRPKGQWDELINWKSGK
jgi:orotate phosphoribosyltransferase